MGTFTSQILVGRKHPYEGGINNISHKLYLTENGRAGWILKEVNDNENQVTENKKVIWIPTIENMLEDALVMIGLYVLKDAQLIHLAEQYFKSNYENQAVLYGDIEPHHLEELYVQARKIVSNHKILISVFRGSSISKQLSVLKHYQNDIEVCQFIYRKENSPWTGQFEESGSLNK